MFALILTVLTGLPTSNTSTATAATPATTAVDVALTIETELERERQLRADRADRAARTPTTAPVSPAAPPAKPAVKRSTPKKTTPPAAAPAPSTSRAATVDGFARAKVGKPSRWAAEGPGAYDCSGLVVAAYRRVGIELPHYTGTLSGRGRAVSRAQLQPGDLVFPSGSHVGIYVGGGMMVHASNPRSGVKLSSIYAFSHARRIL